MWRELFSSLKTAVLLLIFLGVLTGLLYPVFITSVGQILFPEKTSGSLFTLDNRLVGSKLIGQSFGGKEYFWGRPSATPSFPYNAAFSSGSNLGPTNPDLIRLVASRVVTLRISDKSNNQPVPIDLVTASASGLDPDISPYAAFYQESRVAKARGLTEEVVHDLILEHIKNRQFGFLGEPRVNVLELNIALDQLGKKK